MNRESNTEYRQPFVEIRRTRLNAKRPEATLTGRQMLLVPKARIAARSSTQESSSLAPKFKTLCIYKQALPKACLLAVTDARHAMEWQSATADFSDMHTGHWPSREHFKQLAKGSVGFMMIKKPPPKAKATAVVMPKTKKQDELLESVKARDAAYLRAHKRKEMRKSNSDPDSSKNVTNAEDEVPRLYCDQASKIVKKKRKKKHRKTRSVIATTGTTARTREGNLLLHDRGVPQFQVQQVDAGTSTSGCRYIDRGEKCRWGCEEDWIRCHSFMRGECHASSRTRCGKGYHICRQKKLAHQDIRTPPIAERACTCGACPSSRKRKRALAKRAPLFSSQSCEPVPIGKNGIEERKRARELAKAPVTIKTSWSIPFNDDTGIVQNEGNSSSERVTTRSATCVGATAAYTREDIASRDRVAHNWRVEESQEQKVKSKWMRTDGGPRKAEDRFRR